MPIRCKVQVGFILYCTGRGVQYFPLSPQLPRRRPCAFSMRQGQYRARQRRLHMQICNASFALANCRISHLATLGDLHTAYQDFNFLSILVAFFPGACIALRQKQRSIFTRYGPKSPETAVAILGATIYSRLPTTKPQIFPQDPPLADVCALHDDADPMRWF